MHPPAKTDRDTLEKVNRFLQAPFIIAWYLFGFLLEFILQLPFMIAFYLGKRHRRNR